MQFKYINGFDLDLMDKYSVKICHFQFFNFILTCKAANSVNKK